MISFQKSITKEEINDLPLEAFEGEIVIIDSDEGLDEAVEYLKQFPVLGFDTETKPSFTKGNVNPVALLQLSSFEKSFLFGSIPFQNRPSGTCTGSAPGRDSSKPQIQRRTPGRGRRAPDYLSRGSIFAKPNRYRWAPACSPIENP